MKPIWWLLVGGLLGGPQYVDKGVQMVSIDSDSGFCTLFHV